jgi:hypothetical protein
MNNLKFLHGVILMKQTQNGRPKKLIWLQTMGLIVLFMIGTGIPTQGNIYRRDWKRAF